MRTTTPRQNKWLTNVGAALFAAGLIAQWVLPFPSQLEGIARYAYDILIISAMFAGAGLMLYAMLTRPRA